MGTKLLWISMERGFRALKGLIGRHARGYFVSQPNPFTYGVVGRTKTRNFTVVRAFLIHLPSAYYRPRGIFFSPSWAARGTREVPSPLHRTHPSSQRWGGSCRTWWQNRDPIIRCAMIDFVSKDFRRADRVLDMFRGGESLRYVMVADVCCWVWWKLMSVGIPKCTVHSYPTLIVVFFGVTTHEYTEPTTMWTSY